MTLILASNSPRRRELLAELVPAFRTQPSRFEEKSAGLCAYRAALVNACGKARDVAAQNAGCAVLGADTVVELNGAILSKPASSDEARGMLRSLSGREHTVYTGVCLIANGQEQSDVVKTRVLFATLSDDLIERYVASGLPMDKAGAYGIQDGYPLVERYEGSYTNVVGLPVERVRQMLHAAGLLPEHTC